MKRLSSARNLASPLLCLSLGLLLAGACATEANTLEPDESGGTGGKASAGNGGKASAGNGGKTGAFGGSSAGKAAGGMPTGGAPIDEDGGDGPIAMAGMGGASAPVDKCQTSTDCTQVAGSCFVCEEAGPILDCVDKGEPECGNDALEPCELCEEGDEEDCTALGMPGEFSGGTATCNAACDGWDTSACFVCGNDIKEGDEDCDGPDPVTPPECDAGSENPGTPTPCTDECVFDTTVCNGCTDGIEAADCLDGTDCAGANCNGAECKLGTECSLNCSGGGITCDDVRCNHESTCDFNCTSSGHCTNLVCDSDSSCNLNCSTGGSSCDGTTCKTGAVCAFDCSGSGHCTQVDCQPGAECDFTCNAGGSTCGGNATCSDGMTCTYDCNQSGNCSALQVTCEAGSICEFNCVGGGSTCPKATCEADADCTFDCSQNGNCNAPTCASGACTGN